MLQVPTRINVSPIHGIGLFAAAPISKGTTIWEFTPHFDVVFTPKQLETLHPCARELVEKYSYFDESFNALVLCGDDARFMNHSPTPNTDDGPSLRTVAKRDIAEGEELTCNYADLGVDADEFERLGLK